ncbi:hypothetical protein ACN20G_00975 [Streptomyces sp. BI20]|uniref:hypothetical protein n=1 Tax=Streptomyces sp. BI20 TaxID=3403460 RepID=UPI003C70E146
MREQDADWTTPSQAEGEREEDTARSGRRADLPRTTPSQAEGERDEGEDTAADRTR